MDAVAALYEVFAGYPLRDWTDPWPALPDRGRRAGAAPGAAARPDPEDRRTATRSDTVGLGVGLYADYGPAHRMYLSRGYPPDGCGIAYQSESVPPGTPVKVDDDLTS